MYGVPFASKTLLCAGAFCLLGNAAAASCFVRGDTDCNGVVEQRDAMAILEYLFLPVPGAPCLRFCLDSGDVDDDGDVQISDAIHLMSYVLRGAPEIPPPARMGEQDPTPDALPCSCMPAPRLEERDESGAYSPYHATGEMNRPRYLHQIALTRSGIPCVFGGSDERGFSAIETVEFFDQSTCDKDAPCPESQTGLWLDTNFEGDPISLVGGPRLLFTVDRLADGRFLCAGGTGDLLAGGVVSVAEVLDPATRTSRPVGSAMIRPRFRHASILQGGRVVLVGGQIQSTVMVPDPDVAPEQAGRPIQVTVFVSTPESEVYRPGDQTFELLRVSGTDTPSELNTPEGRAGHAMARLAGPDQTLSTADDPVLVAGGFQTPSGGDAPQNKLPGAVASGTAAAVRTIEFYDPRTRVFTAVANSSLPHPRINDPYIVNLGQFNDFTIDGVKGMGNVVLVTHGNDDAAPDCPQFDEVLSATYTGFGPSEGLHLFRVEDPRNGSHAQGGEYLPLERELPAVVGRCATNPVALPRLMAGELGAPRVQTWVFAVAGVHTRQGRHYYGDSLPEGGSPTIRAGCLFDPFFSVAATQLGLSSRELSMTRTTLHPTGVVGAWLTLDGSIPTVDLTAYGSTQASGWARSRAERRVFCRNVQIAGEDGLFNTTDDRILLTGGGTSYPQTGGVPTIPSAEILLPPRVNEREPWR